jgi:hypothetical protein
MYLFYRESTLKVELDKYNNYIKNLSDFVDKLLSFKNLRNNQKFVKIRRLINDFTIKYY